VKSLSTSEQENKTEKKAYLNVLKVTPLARKSVEDVKEVVNELYGFTQSIGGDIARLGEERVVIVPNSIKIWRQEISVSEEKASTAA